MSDPLAQFPPGTDLYAIPLQPPPDGVVPNFSKRSDLLSVTIVVCALMLSCEVTVLGLRIWTKRGRNERWNLDDWFAIATVVFTGAFAGIILNVVPTFGQEGWNVSVGTITSPWSQRMIVCEGFLSSISLWTGKMCILALFYQFFGHADRVRYQIWVVFVMCLPLLSMAIFMPIQSAPAPGKPWGTTLNPKNSDSNVKASLAVGVVNLLVDLMIFYIPIPVIVTLNLNRRKKVGVLAIFLTGLIAIVVDAIVMYYRVKLYIRSSDLRASQIVPLCSFVEACISVICSSMPSLAKVYRHHILPSQLFILIRSRLSSDNSKSSPFSELPELEKAQPKRKKGPYSISTTLDFSYMTKCHTNDLELLTVPKCYSKPVSSIQASQISYDVGAGRIQKDMTWEHQSHIDGAKP